MKIESYKFPKSSFLSVEKDMSLIASYLLKNERLKKLLYYTTPDCLSLPDLTDKQSIELIHKNIKIVPKLYVDGSLLNYVIISFDDFIPNGNNPEFRDNKVEFDIVCHFDQWNLSDFQLRPYKIAAEVDSMMNEQRLTGIGKLEFAGASQILLTDEYAGICLMYRAVHGGEDEVNAPKEIDEADIIKNFDKIFNNK